MRAHTHAPTHAPTHAHTHAHTHKHTHAHTHKHTHAHTHKHTHTRTHNAHTHKHTQAHTHTHTHAHSSEGPAGAEPPTFDKECVVGIPSRMLLGLKESVKVPEGTLHKVVGGHLLKSHFQEDGAILGPHLHQGVQVTADWGDPQGLEVIWLERLALPAPTEGREAKWLNTAHPRTCTAVATHVCIISGVRSVSGFSIEVVNWLPLVTTNALVTLQQNSSLHRHSLTHTFTHTLTPSLRHSLTPSHTHIHSLTHTPSLTHPHSHTFTHTHSHTLTHTLLTSFLFLYSLRSFSHNVRPRPNCRSDS